MPGQDNNLLLEAIARNAGLVISYPSAGMLRHYKSRFLGEDPDGVWVESTPQERTLIDALVGGEQPCGVSFKAGVQKVVFATPLLRRDPAYRVNADVTVEALLLRRPEQVKAIQRRNNYRVAVPRDSEVALRVWRMNERAPLRDRPLAAQELQAQIRDISLGGLGCTLFGKDGKPPVVTPDDRLRIQLTNKAGDPLLIEGRLCYPKDRLRSDVVRAGLQFKAMENTIEGRQTLAALTRIVGELAREEVRRLRLGIKSA